MPKLRNASVILALLVSQLNGSESFAPKAGRVADTSPSSTARDMKTKQPPAIESPQTTDIMYGEESRKYRRTVYSHDDWVKHRSPNRFLRNLKSFSSSGVIKNLGKEVISTSAVAAVLVVWNMIFGEYQDLMSVTHNGILHDSLIPVLALPLAPFTLASPSLGLLLVFRTNTSYKRWDEARKNWGMNINHTRDLVRLGSAYYDRSAVSPERAEEDLTRLALCTWAFVRSMKRHLSPAWEDEDDFQNELKEKLPEDQAQKIIDAAHRPNRALQDLSVAIENLPMHFMRRNEIHSAATIFEDNLGSSERLLSSPIPVFYTRHTARFLSFWLLLLPFGLWGPLSNSWNHIALIPITTILSIFLFGIEELATSLEEPFTILPMQAFCDKIYNWITEITTFKPGDNGMPVYYYDNYNMDMEYGVSGVAMEYGVSGVTMPVVAASAAVTVKIVEEEILEEVAEPEAVVADPVVKKEEEVPELLAALYEEDPEVPEPVVFSVDVEVANGDVDALINGEAPVSREAVPGQKRYAVKRAIGETFGAVKRAIGEKLGE